MSSLYSENYLGIDWGPDVPLEKTTQKSGKSSGLQIIPDVEPFQSPIDKSYITSRQQLREHEKVHNVRQIGNDYAGSGRPPNWDEMTNGRN